MPDALIIEDLVAGYADAKVLEGVSLSIDPGQTIAVLGRNGVGKTTLLNAIVGRAIVHDGRIRLGSHDLVAAPRFARCRLGIGLVPQEREVFHSLSVEENLRVAQAPGKWTSEAVYELFPRLAERKRNYGNELSGGEQQMLAIARAIVGNPSTLLLDEPLEGLAPVIVDSLMEALDQLKRQEGLTIALVEQRAGIALEFAERAVVLDRGRIVYSGGASALFKDRQQMGALLGIAR